jgi:hypothetical protein
MSPDTYRLVPAWPEALVYEEDAERILRFACRSLEEPPIVSVPSAERWPREMPPWAHARRALILERLRAGRCILCEEDGLLNRFVSLDGSLAVELEHIPDDRTGPWERMCVLRLPEGERLAATTSRGTPSNVRFPSPGVVQVAITDRGGEPRQLWIDASARRFRFFPEAQSWPLSELETQLGYGLPAKPALPVKLESRAAALGALLGSLVLSAAGVWMMLAGDTVKDRLLGALCALFFAACAVVPRLRARK